MKNALHANHKLFLALGVLVLIAASAFFMLRKPATYDTSGLVKKGADGSYEASFHLTQEVPDPPTLSIPRGTIFRLKVTSEVSEVVHVDDYHILDWIEPGESKELTVVTDGPGTHKILLDRSEKILAYLEVM